MRPSASGPRFLDRDKQGTLEDRYPALVMNVDEAFTASAVDE